LKSIQEVQDSALVAIEEAQMCLETVNQETRERLKLQDNGKNTVDKQQQSNEILATETSSNQIEK
jgi:hypothetical protein